MTRTRHLRRPDRPASDGSANTWSRGKRPVFQFVAVFAVLMVAFYACTFIPILHKDLLPRLQRANAVASTAILNLFGENATSRDTNIVTPRYPLNIAHGCDAVEPIALFVAAVLAFPTRWRPKLPGLLIGTAVLAVLNLVRIVSLYYTGVHWPIAFETMHVDVWQPAFIVLSLFFWVLWALWATRPTAIPADVAS